MSQKPHGRGKPPTCRSSKLKLEPKEYCAACACKQAADSCVRRQSWFAEQNRDSIILASSCCVHVFIVFTVPSQLSRFLGQAEKKVNQLLRGL